jgi:uncharacterized membrane protein (DUF106 family)
MPGEDIIRIACTVGVTQVVCDLLARQFLFQKEPYKRALERFERAQSSYDKVAKEYEAKKDTKQQEKVKKRLDRAKNELGERKAEVAKTHSGAGIMTSFVFLLLFRILGAEHGGKIMGIIPFVPFGLLRKVTMRGLDFGGDHSAVVALLKDSTGVNSAEQACSYVIIYLLSNMSVKFFLHKAIGEAPPAGADQGLYSVMESPSIARGLKQMGLDPDELKQD